MLAQSLSLSSLCFVYSNFCPPLWPQLNALCTVGTFANLCAQSSSTHSFPFVPTAYPLPLSTQLYQEFPAAAAEVLDVGGQGQEPPFSKLASQAVHSNRSFKVMAEMPLIGE